MESEKDSQKQPSINKSDSSELPDIYPHNTNPKSFKPTKIIGFPQRNIDIIFRGDDDKPSGIIRIKKRKFEHLFTTVVPKFKRNPDKKTLSSIGKFPAVSQVYTYSNNDMYVYIQKGADYVRLDKEEFFLHIAELIQTISEDRDLTNNLIAASISLQLRGVKRPFLKIGLDQIKELNLQDFINESIQKSEEKREVWK